MKSDISGSILVVDDDNDVLYTAKLALKGHCTKVDTLDRPALIPEYMKAGRYDVIILDMNFTRGCTSGKEGLEWLDKILKIDSDAQVITTTAYGEINLAVTSIKKGAIDFITKPWNCEQLVATVKNLITQERKEGEVKKDKGNNGRVSYQKNLKYPEIISRSPVMAQVMETIKTVAPTDANVLILGENGTGKELAAWALHSESLRGQNSFVHVDLGSIPEALFEAELFGHTKGAFTDAREERGGRFEVASGGTLFLDEIGNLNLLLQSKILTAIQHGEIVRIGSNQPIPLNVRLISATNKPVYDMVDTLEFRQDLLYRINTVEIILPPLRERKEDIELIADHYLNIYSEQYGKQGVRISGDALVKLNSHQWPGNIRELSHAIERAVILCKSGTLREEDFNLRTRPKFPAVTPEPAIRIEEFERKAISIALAKNSGNLSKAAEEIGVARSTLYRKIAQLGIGN